MRSFFGGGCSRYRKRRQGKLLLEGKRDWSGMQIFEVFHRFAFQGRAFWHNTR